MFTERKRSEIADKNKHYRGFRFKENGPVIKDAPTGLALTTWSSDDEDGSRHRIRRGGGGLKGGMPVNSSNTVAYAVIHTQATAVASSGAPGGKV